MVRKPSRLASVCRRLAGSWIAGLALTAGRGSARSAGTTDALKTEVVIPDSTKNGADLILAARAARQFHDYSVGFRAGLKIKRNSLPIVGAAGRWRRSYQRGIVRRVNNQNQWRSPTDQFLSTQIKLEMILRVGRNHDRLSHWNSVEFIGRHENDAQASVAAMRDGVDADPRLRFRSDHPVKALRVC